MRGRVPLGSAAVRYGCLLLALFAVGCASLGSAASAVCTPGPRRVGTAPSLIVDDGLANDGERVLATGRFTGAHVRICAYVSTDRSRWVLQGGGQSDGLGWISIALGSFSTPGDYVVRLENPEDGIGAEATIFVRARGTRFAVFDVDGTLTQSEITPGLFEGPAAQPRKFGPELAKALQSRGCLIVYLTARAYQMTNTTREWRERSDFPMGVVHVSPSPAGLGGAAAGDFKRTYLEQVRGPVEADGSRFIADFAFGNRRTDLAAYSAVYPRARIYLIDLPPGDLGTELSSRHRLVRNTWEEALHEVSALPTSRQCGGDDKP